MTGPGARWRRRERSEMARLWPRRSRCRPRTRHDGTDGDARSHRAEAAALVDGLSDEELSLRLDAPAWLAAAELYLDLYAEADAHASRALTLARATGRGDPPRPVPAPAEGLVRAREARRGDRAPGRRHRSRAPARDPAGSRRNLFNRSVVALAAGDLDIALDNRGGGRRGHARARRRLRHGLGRGTARGCPARDWAAGPSRRAAPRPRRRRGAGAHPWRLAGLLPGAAHAMPLALDRRREAERAAGSAGSAPRP